ncbi:MAG TPA: FHA domain-containing protein [Gemmatimonadaceae bacterium]|nr:FHA domain-containing protein [Gemmatimonadaceae bacterium]
MSFLIIDNERYALQMGDTVLGGSDDEVLSLSPLAQIPPFAVLSCSPDGAGSIRRLRQDEEILIDGQPLGAETRALKHGNHISVAGLDISYGEMRAAGGTAHIGSVSVETLSPVPVAESTGKASNGRVVRLADGKTTFIPSEGLEIGRDPTCGLVLASKSVSRRHAEIAPFQQGYRLTDQSRNGAFVNGTRVREPQILYNGDVIRLGTEELRFEAN